MRPGCTCWICEPAFLIGRFGGLQLTHAWDQLIPGQCPGCLCAGHGSYLECRYFPCKTRCMWLTRFFNNAVVATSFLCQTPFKFSFSMVRSTARSASATVGRMAKTAANLEPVAIT